MPDYCPAGGVSKTISWATSDAGPLDELWNVTMRKYTTIQQHLDEGDGWSQIPIGTQVSSHFEVGIELGNLDESDTPFLLRAYWTQTTPTVADRVLTVGNILSTFTDENVYLMWDFPKQSQLYGPQTLAVCNDTYYEVINGSLTSNNTPADAQAWFPLLGALEVGGGKEIWRSPDLSLFQPWGPSIPNRTFWVDPPDLGPKTPSIGAVMVLNNLNYTKYVDVITCSLYASWLPVKVYMDTKDLSIHPTIAILLEDIIEYGRYANWNDVRDAVTSAERIRLAYDWANAALPPNETIKQITYPLLLENLEIRGFGVALSLLVTDALARFGMASGVILADDSQETVISDYFALEKPADDNDNSQILHKEQMIKVNFSQIRYGYGYSLQGVTRRLATGILMLHVLLALVHSLAIVYLGWSCPSLSSLHEFFALAMNSPPTPKLENTCAGIERLDTYKHVTEVKEVSHKHLAFVLDGGKGSYNDVDVNEEYGQMGEAEGRSLAIND
jgi:hypothetical protein